MERVTIVAFYNVSIHSGVEVYVHQRLCPPAHMDGFKGEDVKQCSLIVYTECCSLSCVYYAHVYVYIKKTSFWFSQP